MIATHPAVAHHDPIARLAWICLLILAVWINVVSYQPPAQAQGTDPGTIILQATPTPALPTPAPDAPAFTLIAPTPIVVYVEVPGPTPPDVVYVTTQAGATDELLPPIVTEQAFDPALHPDDAAAALAEAYQDLPTAGAPPDAAAEAASDAYQQRRLDSGAYRPRTR